MALQERQITVKFAGGLERKMDSKSVPSTKLLVLRNAVFDKAITLKKRNGYRALGRRVNGSASLLAGARRLASRLSELIAFTSNTAYSYQPSADAWQEIGAAFSAVATSAPVVRTGTMQTMPDHASNAGLTAFAWEDSRGGVWWCAQYTASGQMCRGPEVLDASGAAPRCVAVGEVIHIYWTVAASRFVKCAVANPANPQAAPTTTVIIDDLDSTNGVYDVVPTTRANEPAFIAWKEHATTNVRLGYVDASGVLGSPVTGHPSVLTYAATMAATSPLACAWVADVGFISYVSGTDVAVQMFLSPAGTATIAHEDTLTPITGTTSIQRIALAMADTSEGYVAAEEASATASHRYVIVNRTGTVAAQARTIRSVGLASRAFAIADDVFATFVHDTTYFGTYVTLRLSDFAPVGRVLPGQGAGAPSRKHLPSAHADGDSVAIALPCRQRLPDSAVFTETGISLVTLDFDSEDSHVSATLGRGLYLAGACPLHYDGRAWTELGFHFGPELITGTPAAGGSMTAERTYLYRVWYEWTDAQGEVHRGPMSVGTEVVLAAAQTQVTLALPTLRVTQKSNVRICVGRSLANDETQLFRVTSLDPNTTGANGYVANDKTIDSISFLDRMSDATLRTQEPLYTNGGFLSNDPSPFGSVLASGKNRLFWSDPSDGDLVRYSQPLDEGYGAECPPELFTRTDPHGGAVTGLAVMDELIVVFKERALYAFAGDGPLPNGMTGDGAGFSSPQLITADVGCTDPNSIALTPVGLVFKSAKGIMLLGRDRSVQYIGAPVEGFNGQTVRRATVLPDRTAVVFLTDSGESLLWDYFYQQWSSFTNHEGYDSSIALGSYHYLRTDERIFAETIDAHLDAGRPITMRLETAWIHMQEHLQGFQRFYELHLLGERKSAHQLKIQYRIDYGGHWSAPVYLDATGASSVAGWVGSVPLVVDDPEPLVGTAYGDGNYGDGNYGGIAPGVYQWRVHIGERAESIQFRFEDVGSEGAGFELTEMTLTGGVKANTTRPVAATRSA